MTSRLNTDTLSSGFRSVFFFERSSKKRQMVALDVEFSWLRKSAPLGFCRCLTGCSLLGRALFLSRFEPEPDWKALRTSAGVGGLRARGGRLWFLSSRKCLSFSRTLRSCSSAAAFSRESTDAAGSWLAYFQVARGQFPEKLFGVHRRLPAGLAQLARVGEFSLANEHFESSLVGAPGAAHVGLSGLCITNPGPKLLCS